MRGRPGPKWTVQVNVPPERAYAYVADFTRHQEWGMDDMVITHRSGQGVGAKYDAEGNLGPRRNKSVVTVTDLEPPRRIEFEAEDSNSISGHVFTFTPEAGGTLITRQIYGVKQPFFAPLLLLVFGGAINKNFNGALANLKRRLEANSAPS